MAEARPESAGDGHPLLTWALVAFHAALVVVLVVGALYAAGLAGNQLAALDTAVGVVAYGYLWGVTWWTNRRWLENRPAGLDAAANEQSALLAAAMMWGGVTGLLAFVPAFVVFAVVLLGTGSLASVGFVALAAAIGATASAAAGAVAGGVLGVIDVLLWRAAGAWLPAAAGDGGTGDAE